MSGNTQDFDSVHTLIGKETHQNSSQTQTILPLRPLEYSSSSHPTILQLLGQSPRVRHTLSSALDYSQK